VNRNRAKCRHSEKQRPRQDYCESERFREIKRSRKIRQKLRRDCSYILEILAIVKALKKFRVYLLDIPFKIVTDCKAFLLTMNRKDLCVRIARWALALEEYAYEIQHKSDNSMKHVGALSRNPFLETLIINECDENSL